MKDLFNLNNEEKKVEYIELIYDLIFVYIVGRNNSLLHHVENGFVSPGTFATYILTTLIALQIWYFTTTYINRYGTNGLKEHVCMFINMYLLYFIADGTRVDWEGKFLRYNVAWALILANLFVQYYLKLRERNSEAPWEAVHIRSTMRNLLVQIGIILVSIPLFPLTGIAFSPLAVFAGIFLVMFSQNSARLVTSDFAHLTERVMLYVVFTFGEMIIGIAGYFDDGFDLSTAYLSLMAFLVVAGLFLSYGLVYDHFIDREMNTSGAGYMMIHIFLITALNNITVAMEFMQEPEVAAVPKNVFLVCSFLVYFLFLFMTGKYSRIRVENNKGFFFRLLGILAVFSALMILCYRNGYVSIALTVAMIYAIYFMMWRYRGRICRSEEEEVTEL